MRQSAMGILLLGAAVQSAPAQDRGPSPATRTVMPGHTTGSPSIRAGSRAGAVELDGRLDEAVWSAIEPATGFTQQAPNDGQPATQRTEVRFLFDEDALYIGARMYDTEGAEGIRSRLVRRDQQTEADRLEIIFDTYHNHLGRTSFSVNPSGVRYDAGQASEFTDPSWDPVWEARTAIDEQGWTAELRIPFSQLRFPRDSVQTWGLQIWRTASRINELSMWSHWGRSESGGPQRFGHLEGLEVQRGTRRLEVLPYVVGRGQLLRPGDPGDPFFEQRSTDARFGGDLKYLLTSNLTLDATINPDFGQVEVDPAVVNLSAFETFFPERRPFFIEGSGVFGFGGFNCYFCSNVSSMSLFYSRRIGRSPQGSAPPGTEYADVPDASTILGAAKVSGRTGGGWTIGLLDAVTSREHARTMSAGVRGSHEVEPLTNYFVGRVRKDLNGGNLTLGAIATSVSRFTNEATLTSRLPDHAEALG
ncbi:MAG: carbohydrate binding family 9 domain-containing protein, partial [Actinomycetota bacterium]|nr:carbohydrate binding family 9 domain-containing protein [Actinomycetota bacterium]